MHCPTYQPTAWGHGTWVGLNSLSASKYIHCHAFSDLRTNRMGFASASYTSMTFNSHYISMNNLTHSSKRGKVSFFPSLCKSTEGEEDTSLNSFPMILAPASQPCQVGRPLLSPLSPLVSPSLMSCVASPPRRNVLCLGTRCIVS